MRQIININKSWKFSKGELCNNSNKKNKLINVNIPHTWNNLDGQDGGNDYYRGTCYYLKKLGKIKKEENQVIYLEFNGVNAESYIYFNDHELFHHQGGFSTFRIRIDEYLNDENIYYESHKSFKDLLGVNGGKLTYDLYIPKYNLLIEAQGVQHEKPIEYFGGDEQFKIQQEHDKRKREYAENNNFDFLEIWYYQNAIDILKDKLQITNPTK